MKLAVWLHIYSINNDAICRRMVWRHWRRSWILDVYYRRCRDSSAASIQLWTSAQWTASYYQLSAASLLDVIYKTPYYYITVINKIRDKTFEMHTDSNQSKNILSTLPAIRTFHIRVMTHQMPMAKLTFRLSTHYYDISTFWYLGPDICTVDPNVIH